METLAGWADVRWALRSLLKERAFVAVAMTTLAIGIAGTVIIFSIFDSVVLRALPFDDPDSLWVLRARLSGSSTKRIVLMSAAEFPDYKERCRLCGAMGAFEMWPRTMTGSGNPERLLVGRASQSLFTLLGVQAALGRTFVAGEDEAGRDGVAVLGFGFWQRYFGGRRDVVGRSVTLDDRQFVVVGVLPRGFGFPPGVPVSRQPDMWVPLALSGNDVAARGRRFMTSVWMRMRDGVEASEVGDELEAIAGQLHAEHSSVYGSLRATPVLTQLNEEVLGGARAWIVMLAVAMALLLGTACASVASLFMARVHAKRAEMSARVALGATGGRLVRLALAESTVVAAGAGVIGAAMASAGMEIVRRFGPADVGGLETAALDWRAMGFGVCVCGLAALLSGMLPALAMRRQGIAEAMRGGPPSEALGSGRVREAIVAAEAASAVVLVVGAGLLGGSFVRVMSVDPGFDPEGLAAIGTAVPETRYPTAETRNALIRDVLERMARVPGGRVAAATHLPLANDWNVVVVREGGDPADVDVVSTAGVSPGYFETMGIRLLVGREFVERDAPGAVGTVVISRSLARRLWPGREPLGKRIQLGMYDVAKPWYTVVGVVADVHGSGLDRAPTAHMYQALATLNGYPAPTFAMRGGSDGATTLTAIRSALWTVDRDLPAHEEWLMTEIVGDSVRQRRFALVLVTALGVSASALTAVSMFGVVGYQAGRRTREIGLRIALGASEVHIMAMLVVRGLRTAGVGVLVGLVMAFYVWRWFESVLYGVGASNPIVFGGGATVVLVVAGVAGYLAARRASRLSALVAMRGA